MKKIWAILTVVSVSFGVASCQSRKMNDESVIEKLHYEFDLTSGSQIGLKPFEIALTLDDGPIPESLPLAKKLAAMEVPVTYFMIGQNAKTHANVVREMSELRFSTGPHKDELAAIIANHSWSHRRKFGSIVCIVCDGVDYSIQEVGKADNELAPYIKKQNKPFMFRAPGGNFYRSAIGSEVSDLKALNNTYSKYIGPFRWDVDGDVNPGSCQNGWRACLESYVAQSTALGRNKGIIVLAHDVSAMTRQMLLGDNNNGYIQRMKNLGFKFVAIDKYPDKLSKYGAVPELALNDDFIKFKATPVSQLTYDFSIEVKNASRFDVYVNGLATPLFQSNSHQLETQKSFSQGSNRIFTIKAYDGAGKLMARGDRTVFIQ